MTYTFKIARRLAGNHRGLLGLLALLAAAGCGSEPNVVVSELPGAITLTINGLAEGAIPQVTLSGPDGYRKTITHSGTVTGLAFGNYEVVASPATAQSTTFAPTSERQAITITSGNPTAAAAVLYQVTTGTLDVRLEGLPASTASVVQVEGPSGFSLALAGTSLLKGLAPGTYTVLAAPRYAPTGTFYPTTTATTVNVVASLTPSQARVQFRRVTGGLAVEFTGLPSGAVGTFRLAGPGSYDAALAGAVELTSINPGPYLAVVEEVRFEGHTWAPPETTFPITVDTGMTRLTIPYRIITGALELDVSGLPAGVAGEFVVAGPEGFNQRGTTDATWIGIKPGTYTTTAAAVRSGDKEFKPKKTNQSLPVGPGRSPKRGTIEYTESAGALDLSISGLPAGVEAMVIVTGSASVDTMSAGGTLNGLTAGSYTVEARAVQSDDAIYAGAPASQVISVAGSGSTPATVAYSRTTGALRIDATGLPSGAAAAIGVNGPDRYARSITGSTTLGTLAPGSYVVSAQNVAVNGTSYTATPASQVVAVTVGATGVATVGYVAPSAPTTGSLSIAIGGLPTGTPGLIGVTGPNGFSRTLTATTTLGGLTPGSYTVTAHAVAVGGANYTPTPASRILGVVTGATAGHAVSYVPDAPSTGTLVVSVSGLPAGAAASVSVSHAASGYDQVLSGSDTLSGLTVPATYTVAAQSVTINGTTYTPSPASQTAYLTAGATLVRSVTYAPATTTPTTGSLAVTVSGLPSGAAAAIVVNGPNGYSQSVTASTTLSGLATGSYTIVAAQVSSGGTAYQPTPLSQSASVGSGATTSRSVNYAAQASGGATVTVDTTTRFQVISGWEATAQIGQTDYASVPWADAVADLAANDLGINRIRLEVRAGAENTQDWYAAWRSGAITFDQYRPHRYETINDNGDPNSEGAGRFFWTDLDLSVEKVVLPLKQRVEANGEQLYVNLNYVGFTNQSGHAHSNPAEYAEFILATFRHLQSRYGLVPDGVEVILEPDNNTFWTAPLVGQAIAAAGARLAANGFHPDFIAPSVMNMGNAPGWFDQISSQAGAMNYLTEIAYHRYTGVSNANLAAIASRAAAHNLQTSMLEHIGSGVEDLFKDLTIANVSAWQQFAMAYPASAGSSDNGGVYFRVINGQPVSASRTKLLRQYFRYVREGARRVAATSASSGVRPVAFTNPGGGMAVVLHVDAAGSYTVAGIRPGSYGVELTTTAGTRIQLPNVTASSGAAVTVAPTQTGVLTLYRLP